MKNWAIDLGTTNSSISWSEGSSTKVINMPNGNVSIASMVFNDEKHGLMPQIERRRRDDSENIDIFEEWKISGMKSWEISNKNFLSNRGKEIDGVNPILLSSIIIQTLIETAEKSTNEVIKKITITVPANFNEEARKNTVRAAKKFRKELEVMLAHEPTAAAMALLIDRDITPILGKRILILDIGGGTTDASLVTMFKSNGKINVDVKGTAGLDVAGKTIDSMILKSFIRPAFAKVGLDIQKFNRNSLMYESERIKMLLSNEEDDVKYKVRSGDNEVIVRVPYYDFLKELDRPFGQILAKIDEILINSKLNKEEIDLIVTVGGSSEAPWVEEKLNSYFGKRIVSDEIEPNSAISKGASMIAAILDKDAIFKYKDEEIYMHEKSPNHISITALGYHNEWMINKNEKLPFNSVEKEFYCEGKKKVTIGITSSSKKKYFYEPEDVIYSMEYELKHPELPIFLKLSYDLNMSLVVTIRNGSVIDEFDFVETSIDTDPEKERFKLKRDIKSISNEFVENNRIKIQSELRRLKRLFGGVFIDISKEELMKRVALYMDMNNII